MNHSPFSTQPDFQKQRAPVFSLRFFPVRYKQSPIPLQDELDDIHLFHQATAASSREISHLGITKLGSDWNPTGFRLEPNWVSIGTNWNPVINLGFDRNPKMIGFARVQKELQECSRDIEASDITVSPKSGTIPTPCEGGSFEIDITLPGFMISDTKGKCNFPGKSAMVNWSDLPQDIGL